MTFLASRLKWVAAAQHGDRVSSVGDNDFFSGTDASNPGTRVRVNLSN